MLEVTRPQVLELDLVTGLGLRLPRMVDPPTSLGSDAGGRRRVNLLSARFVCGAVLCQWVGEEG